MNLLRPSLCAAIGICSTVLTGCGEPEWSTEVDASVEAIRILTATEDIVIDSNPDLDSIRIGATFVGEAEPIVRVADGILTLDTTCPKNIDQECDAAWRIEVPEDRLYAVDLSSTYGKIRVSSVQIQGVVHTAYGNVVLNDVRSPEISIEVEHFYQPNFSVLVQHSDIEELRLRASDYVSADFSAPPRSVDIEASTATLQLPRNDYIFVLESESDQIVLNELESSTASSSEIRVKAEGLIEIGPALLP